MAKALEAVGEQILELEDNMKARMEELERLSDVVKKSCQNRYDKNDFTYHMKVMACEEVTGTGITIIRAATIVQYNRDLLALAMLLEGMTEDCRRANPCWERGPLG